MKYKLSKFNYNFTIDSKTMGIYNTLSKALIGLDLQEYEQLNMYSNNMIPKEKEQVYLDNGILIPYTKNENNVVNCSRINSIIDSTVAVYRILPTSACNARCFYCYEDRRNAVFMNKETAEQVCQFISKQSENRAVKIQWFGGEPLMNVEIIDYITFLLRRKYDDSKISFSMITNGSLINDKILQKMVNSWNLSNVQITLDGTLHEYNKRKNYIGIQNAFEIVKNNIILLVNSGINTHIRLNYDFDNYIDIINLIEELGKTLPHVNNLDVYSYHLYGANNDSAIDTKKEEEWFAIQNALIEQGFSTPLRSFSLKCRKSQCFACQTNSFVISSNGELYKCSMAIDDKKAKVGDVWSGIANYKVLERWCYPGLKEKCIDCVYLPICQGGCRAGDLNYSSENCFVQKDFIDDVLRERIKFLKSKKVK